VSRRAEVLRESQRRLTERLAERDARREAEQRIRDMTIVERNNRGRPVSVEKPLPYGGLPASAADTPGFQVGQPVDPSTWPSGNQAQAQAPAQNIEPIIDRNAARDEVYTQMMQQYGGSTAQDAFANAPRSNEVGYSERADIQAWMKAHEGTPMVEQFMEKQRAKGLVNETTTEYGGTQLKMPEGNDLEAIDSRKQAAKVNPATGRTNIQDAQNAVNQVNRQEVVDMFRAGAQLEGLNFGNTPGEPGQMNRDAMQQKGEQPVAEQAMKTESAIPLFSPKMQPASAAAYGGVEPSQIWNMANKGELPVFGGGMQLFTRYAGK